VVDAADLLKENHEKMLVQKTDHNSVIQCPTNFPNVAVENLS
jgi:hypothetical protein